MRKKNIFHKFKQKSRMASSIILVLLFFVYGCNLEDTLYPNRDKTRQQQQMRVLILYSALLYYSDPCNYGSYIYPRLGSAQRSSLIPPSGFMDVTGRVVTNNGKAVRGALVLLEDPDKIVLEPDTGISQPEFYYGTHSSVNNDGTFYLSGVHYTPGDNFLLSVAPIESSYFGRIDMHLDCYLSPRDFQEGWYTGDGGTITGSPDPLVPGGTTALDTTQLPVGNVYDAGTIVLSN